MPLRSPPAALPTAAAARSDAGPPLLNRRPSEGAPEALGGAQTAAGAAALLGLADFGGDGGDGFLPPCRRRRRPVLVQGETPTKRRPN